MTLAPLRCDGTEGAPVELHKRDGSFQAPLKAADNTLWWVLRTD
jgi:hypothetical protein